MDQPLTSRILQKAIILGRDRILECLIYNGIASIGIEKYNSHQTAFRRKNHKVFRLLQRFRRVRFDRG